MNIRTAFAALAAFSALGFAAGEAAAQNVRGVTATEIKIGTQDDLSGPKRNRAGSPVNCVQACAFASAV